MTKCYTIKESDKDNIIKIDNSNAVTIQLSEDDLPDDLDKLNGNIMKLIFKYKNLLTVLSEQKMYQQRNDCDFKISKSGFQQQAQVLEEIIEELENLLW